MSADARSQALIQGTTSASVKQFTFGTPLGEITLVKSLVVFNGDSTTAQFNAGLIRAGGGVEAYFLNQSIAPNAIFEWAGWHVLNPGDELAVGSTNANVAVWASGAVLTGTPHVAPVP